MNVLENFEQKMSTKLNGESRIQPFWQSLIPILLEVLIPMIGNCFAQARRQRSAVKDALKNPGLLQRAMMRRAFSNSRSFNEMGMGFWERQRVIEAVQEVGREADDDELDAMIDLVEENNPYFM